MGVGRHHTRPKRVDDGNAQEVAQFGGKRFEAEAHTAEHERLRAKLDEPSAGLFQAGERGAVIFMNFLSRYAYARHSDARLPKA